MIQVTDNDIHVVVETYLDQMCRKFHNQNGIVVTWKQLGSINKENIKENRLRGCNSDRSLATTTQTSVERRYIQGL